MKVTQRMQMIFVYYYLGPFWVSQSTPYSGVQKTILGLSQAKMDLSLRAGSHMTLSHELDLWPGAMPQYCLREDLSGIYNKPAVNDAGSYQEAGLTCKFNQFDTYNQYDTD